jgi:hypothetical protein
MVVKRIGVSFIAPFPLEPLLIIRAAQSPSAWAAKRLDPAWQPAKLGLNQRGETMEAHDSLATLIGFTGVGLLLLAFVLNLANVLKAESVPYLGLNLVGAGLACLSSWMIDFMPFVILEGTWAIATLVALGRVLAGLKQPS